MRLVCIWWCDLGRRCRILGSQGIPRRTGKAPPCGIWVRQDRRAPALREGLGCCRGCALARASSVFALVERALQPASNTRVTGLTAAIVSLGLPKLQEKSSKTVPFSPKSCPKVTNVTFPRSRGKTLPFAKFDAGRRQSGGFRLRRDARHSRVPAFHKRHGTFDSKLFRIFRTLSNGKSDPQQQAISNLDSRIIRMAHRKSRAGYASHCAPLIYIYQTFVLVFGMIRVVRDALRQVLPLFLSVC